MPRENLRPLVPLLPLIPSTTAGEQKTGHSPVFCIRSTNFARVPSPSENTSNNTDIPYLNLRS